MCRHHHPVRRQYILPGDVVHVQVRVFGKLEAGRVALHRFPYYTGHVTKKIRRILAVTAAPDNRQKFLHKSVYIVIIQFFRILLNKFQVFTFYIKINPFRLSASFLSPIDTTLIL